MLSHCLSDERGARGAAVQSLRKICASVGKFLQPGHAVHVCMEQAGEHLPRRAVRGCGEDFGRVKGLTWLRWGVSVQLLHAGEAKLCSLGTGT